MKHNTYFHLNSNRIKHNNNLFVKHNVEHNVEELRLVNRDMDVDTDMVNIT